MVRQDTGLNVRSKTEAVMAIEKRLRDARDAMVLRQMQMKNPDLQVSRILGSSDSSTYQYKNHEWNRIKKKKGLTAREWFEAIRRNGIISMWSKDIHISKSER